MNRIRRIVCNLILVASISGLTILRLPHTLSIASSASAHTANRPVGAPTARQGAAAIRQLKQSGLYDSLRKAVDTARYEARWEEEPAGGSLPSAYHAVNPAQQLDAYFTAGGLRITAAGLRKDVGPGAALTDTDAAPGWQVSMSLVGYGYGESLIATGDGELTANDNRVEFRRAGTGVTEWYVNLPQGLEQGFTVEAAPGSRIGGERLRLALALNGDLHAEPAVEGGAIALAGSNGAAPLRYGNLYAYDAKGRELPSQMRVNDGRIFLEVDDTDAIYPLTIDPIFTIQQKLTAFDGAADDYFGYSIDVSRDTIVVGAPLDMVGSVYGQGSAYVFVRKDAAWILEKKLTANVGADSANFGCSVAISSTGDTIVVGAYLDGPSFGNRNGSAYVFTRNGGIWSQQQQLTAFDGHNADYFGISVDIQNNRIIVGASRADGSNAHQGAAYIYNLYRGLWIFNSKLTANDGMRDDEFGRTVSIAGEIVIVGSPGDDENGNGGQGSAYIFMLNGGAWVQQQKLLAWDGMASDHFGRSVAVAVDRLTVVIGAPGDLSNSTSNGAAYVFIRTPNNPFWFPQQKLIAFDGKPRDGFGNSVSILETTVVVGAPYDDIGAVADRGSVYNFERVNNSWILQQKLTAVDGLADDHFGFSVSIVYEQVGVGARFDDVGANPNQGSAYVFRRN